MRVTTTLLPHLGSFSNPPKNFSLFPAPPTWDASKLASFYFFVWEEKLQLCRFLLSRVCECLDFSPAPLPPLFPFPTAGTRSGLTEAAGEQVEDEETKVFLPIVQILYKKLYERRKKESPGLLETFLFKESI